MRRPASARTQRPSFLDPDKPPQQSKELLLMTVELSDGVTADLTVHENDDPTTLATEFASQHGLAEEVIPMLVEQIHKNIDQKTQSKSRKSAPRQRGLMTASPFTMSGEEYQKIWTNEVNRCLSKEPEFRPRLNSRTRQIAAKQGRTQIHQRLYSLRPKKENVNQRSSVQSFVKDSFIDLSVTVSANSSVTVGNSKNPGHRLYNQGMRLKQKQMLETQRVQEEEEEELNKTLIFSPRINETSRKMCSRVESLENSLIAQKQIRDSKIQYARVQQKTKEQEECTFTPRINNSSRLIADISNIDSNQSIFEYLYSEAEQRAKRKENLTEFATQYEASFQPEICSKSRYSTCLESREDMINRMSSARKAVEEKLVRARLAQIEPVDSETGQPLYSPKTNLRSPRFMTRSQSRTSVDRLSQPRANKQREDTHPQPKAIPNSSRILERAQKAKIKGIFEGLDLEGSGFITKQALDMIESNEQLEILRPILAGIQDRMDFEQFYAAIAKQLPGLNPGQKAALFRPKLLAPSPEPPSQTARSSSTSLYNRMQQFSTNSAKKTQVRRAEALVQNMEECTFQPKINSRYFQQRAKNRDKLNETVL